MNKQLYSSLFIVALASGLLCAGEEYKHGPDSSYQEGVPKGVVTKHSWTSKIFSGTTRDYWVYVPAQKEKPACVMIFQDGGGYQDVKGNWRVPVVFDNLIHKKEMPVTIGIFINPGVLAAAGEKQLPRFNRSYEYDNPTDQYARFLLEEILPEVGKTYNLSSNPNDRAICGASSGGICAFSAAWHRPDAFRRVLSTIGSFTNLRRAHDLPSLIRKNEPKPIRVFLQDGSNDLDIYAGSWWVSNLDMAAALKYAGYDYKFVEGTGGHDGKQGGAIFPDAIRWLWRDYPQPVATPAPKPVDDKVWWSRAHLPLMKVLIPGEDWHLLGEGYNFTEGSATDEQGNVYFTDLPNSKIFKIDAEGKITLFKENTGNANGLKFGPDGKLYACAGGKKQIVAYDVSNGNETVITSDVESNDLIVNAKGEIYFTDPNKKTVWFVNAEKERKEVDKGLNFPNGIILTPDQGQLMVAEMNGAHVWAYRVEADGTLGHKQPYFSPFVPEGKSTCGADGMTVDTNGNLYVTSHAGIQMFDQAGRVVGIINKPQNKWLANICFGGPNMEYLYAMCHDKVYRRKTKAKGVLQFKAPVQPPAPRL
ncbi:MAG TPA: SMP-30/gluconolactonase/LRE family protein [Planctomycetota bacterium]|nr:SMP-30/gluconolactonase/LRE family protein [Planctomycetota bacterium]